MTIWQFMWPWFKRQWKPLSGAIALSMITVLAGVGLFTVAGWFLTGAFLAGSLLAFNLFVPSALVRGLSFLRVAARYAERIVGHVASFHLLADIRTAVFARSAVLSPAQLARYQEGDLVARLVGDIDVLDTLFLLVVAPVCTAIAVSVLFGTFVGLYLPVLAVLLMLIMAVAVCLLPGWAVRRGQTSGAGAQEASAQARALVHDVVAGHTDIAAFAMQGQSHERFTQASRGLFRTHHRIAGISALGEGLQQVLMGVALMATLLLGLTAFREGRLEAPIWVGLILGVMGLFEVAVPLMRGASRMGMSAAAVARVSDVLREEPLQTEPVSPLPLPLSGSLELKNLHYAYRDEAPVLAGLDLCVRQGEHLAIAGASGSGKSTLLSLLLRVYEPDKGALTYGGVALDRVHPDVIYRRFTLLSQYSPVFLGTIRSNLLIAKPDATDDELRQVLRDARLHDFVHSLEAGLDTWVGEEGRRLSLGQARRLCLARAMLTPASVWILDEPTAGLDTATHAEFFSDLRRVAAGRTVIVATHAVLPPHTVDRVVYLSGGTLRSPDQSSPKSIIPGAR